MIVLPNGNLIDVPNATASTDSKDLERYLGTQINLMMSPQVQNAARQKLREDKTLVEADVNLEVWQLPKTFIIEMKATSTSPIYAQRY